MLELFGAVIIFLAICCAFFAGLRIGVLCLLLLRPLSDRLFAATQVNFVGGAISLGAILNLAVAAILLLMWRRIVATAPAALVWAWIPFLVVSGVATVYSPVPGAGFRKWMTFLTFATMFFLPFILAQTTNAARGLLRFLVLASLPAILFALGEAALNSGDIVGLLVMGTFTHPNILAFYITTLIGVVAFLLSERAAGSQRVMLLAYLVPLLMILLATQTRSAWAAAAVLALIYGLTVNPKALAAMAAAVLVALLVPGVRDRIADAFTETEYIGAGIAMNSFAWRQALWADALQYFSHHPVLGNGTGSFIALSATFFGLAASSAMGAHNVYIQLLVEGGIVGCLSFTFLLGVVGIFMLRRWRWAPREVAPSLGLLITYAIICYSDNLLDYLVVNWIFWFALGAMVRIVSLARGQQPAEHWTEIPVRGQPILSPP